MFKNRKDAGEKLAKALQHYKGERLIVLAIPKGGVEIGYQVAKFLNSDFSTIISRKLPYPDNPEAGFGAITEDGSIFILDYAARGLSKYEIDRIIKEQKQEISRRIAILRGGKPLPDIAGKTVILVDDGIAMGSTMRAAISLCKNKKAKKIIVASPVAGSSTADELAEFVDDVIILEQPIFFRAVAQVYKNWYDVSDEEVIQIMNKWQKEKKPTQRETWG
jgi:putative phosphoribosyl transferase